MGVGVAARGGRCIENDARVRGGHKKVNDAIKWHENKPATVALLKKVDKIFTRSKKLRMFAVVNINQLRYVMNQSPKGSSCHNIKHDKRKVGESPHQGPNLCPSVFSIPILGISCFV